MNTENSPFFTIQEVSKFVGISISTINRLVKEGDFPKKVKITPRRIVFMKNDIEDWIKSKKKQLYSKKTKGHVFAPFES